MAYVNVAEWKPDQVTDWLKGLDSMLVPYIHSFLNNQVNGQQVLNLRPDDLEHLGVFKLGHQELILEAVEHLRHFHYELDRETLQILALRLSCLAHSLHNDLNRNHMDSLLVSTQTLADVANIVTSVKPLVCWLDRPPFSGQLEYSARKSELLSLSLEMATCGQRDRFAERPVEEIRTSSGHLAVLADSIIQDIQDPLLLQPASLELVTLKKRSSDDLGFYIVPSYHGIHQIGELKLNSAAHQSGKLEPGDEIVQINYQTVVGWQVKQVMALFEEFSTEVLLTVKKRPKHTKVYGQIYMKPYRLPSKKRATQNSFTRWHDNLPSPRPELLTIPDFEMPLPKSISVESTVSVCGRLPSSSEEECELVDGNVASSPTSVRLYLPKPRLPVQRRATITGASPLSKRAPVNLQQFWEELKLEREWRGVGSSGDKPRVAQLIQDCESRANYARKYSSFDSLKDRNASCFLQESKPDVVSSCQEREKSSAGVNELFSSVQSMENRPTEVHVVPRTENKETNDGSDDVFKSNEVLEKSTGSDDVFKTVESLGRSSKRSTELDEVFKTVDDISSDFDEASGHLRNKSVDSDSVFVSDSEISEHKVSSLKEKIELFSKVPVQIDKPLAALKKVKPKVPARTFRLSPDKNIPPKVLARVVKDHVEDKSKNVTVVPDPKPQSLPNFKSEPIRKEKGRLDKSYSTPAYDTSEEKVSLQNILRPNKPVQLSTEPILEDSKSDKDDSEKNDSNNSAKSSLHSLIDSVGESEKEVHGQIVETINKHLLRMDDEVEVEPKWKDQKTLVNLDVEHPPDEIETEEKIGKILETINSSLVERRKEMERESKIRKPSEGVDLSKTISQVCQEEILQTYNPSGFSSDKSEQDFVVEKIKTPTIVLALPRVRVTPPSLHEEMHGLPDVTLTHQPPETPKRKPMSNFDCVDKSSPPAPATFPRQKVDARRPITPPEPPPRPTPPASSVLQQSQPVQQPQHKGACYRAMMVARSVGKSATSKASSVASPKALRKKNPLLAKHRNVSVKDLGSCECQGWLQQRYRKGSGQWNRGWYLIKGTTFYGFKSKEANRAEVMIHLPGFTVSVAEEVKSRKYAFKVYHTGKMFYFAADNQEELTAWVDSVTMATLTQDSHSEAILYSESEGEPSGDEGGSESCFSSPKMKKIAGLLSSPSKVTSHPATPVEKSTDVQKKFGSLKKLRGKGNDHTEHTADCSSGGSSLDRKYLGFLGRGPSVPVPTAQFRSYRRVAPPLPRPLHQSAESVLTLDTSSGGVYVEGGAPQRSPHNQPQTSPGLPPDMADYRLASLAKSNRRRDGDQDTSGFVTLEALMLSRQEEERRAHIMFQTHLNESAAAVPQFRAPPPPTHRSSPIRQNGLDTGRAIHGNIQHSRTTQRLAQQLPTPGPATTLRPSHSRSTSAGFGGDEKEVPSAATVVRRSSFNNPSSRLNRNTDLDCRDYRDGSPEKLWIDSLRRTDTTDNRRYPPTPRHVHNLQDWRNNKLKKAALYQPPPVSPLDNPGINEESRMRLGTAFEMTLDQSLNDSQSKRIYSKSGPTPAARLRNLFTSKTESQTSQKSLLGSPRLHRAFFRGSVTRADSGGESLNSPPLSPPQDLDLPIMNLRPLPVSNPPTPDYPGLEYPPVFEPGTYSLSDASTLLRHRNRDDR